MDADINNIISFLKYWTVCLYSKTWPQLINVCIWWSVFGAYHIHIFLHYIYNNDAADDLDVAFVRVLDIVPQHVVGEAPVVLFAALKDAS